MRYEEIRPATIEDAQASFALGDFDTLAQQVVAVALSTNDVRGASALCADVARVKHSLARGNAILCLGHLARRFGDLDRSIVEPLVIAGLNDPDAWVRGHAHSAADDLETFLGWQTHARAGT